MRLRRKLRLSAVLVAMICAGLPCTRNAACQIFDLGNGRVPLVSLDGPWRFQVGDSPGGNGDFAWARPGYDDSDWAVVRGGQSWASQGYPILNRWAWYRFKVTIPPGKRGTSLLLAPIVTGYELFVDGRPVATVGNIPPNFTPKTSFSYAMYPLTTEGSAAERTVTVAIRVWHSPLWANYMEGGSYSTGNLAGDPDLLADELEHRQLARKSRFVDWYSYSIAAGLVGLVVLCLFLIRPMEREYLSFATMLLAEAADSVANLLHEIWAWPAVPIFDIIDGSLIALSFIANFYFITRILQVRTGKRSRLLVVLAAISGPCAGLYWTHWISVAQSAALELLLLLPVVVWSISLLARYAARGNSDARLLMLPMLLSAGYYAFDNLLWLLSQAGLVHRPSFMDHRIPLPPFSIHAQILLDLIFLVAMLVFLIRRFTLARRQEERMGAEFEAARQVQRVMVPELPAQCPGFRLQSVYQPADQVGGDFFQQIADAEGGLLIVVGDVSGKGLPAAMVVSALVGAIRAEAEHGRDPATMLEALNARAIGNTSGGFVTCMAVHICGDGMMTVANAGHLPPYLNRKELEVAASLPLGLVEGLRYDKEFVQLRPGDVLTFISDGVVEAQKPNGELLGFERTQRLIGESAERIAQVAVEFGQVDDITVLTVEYCGAPCEEPANGAAVAKEVPSS